MASSVFEEVTLVWEGKEYKIPADGVMRLLAQMEDAVTMADLYRYHVNGRPPIAKLATAYGMALRHAGCFVKDEEVYEGMFKGGAAEVQRRVFVAVEGLLALMVPPSTLQETKEDPAKKDDSASNKSASSPRRTKPR